MALDQYREKRDFRRTPEPTGDVTGAPGARFVVQQHAARRLHYDFRLELNGVLKSWAVTRGPSLDPADKRLAVQVEDHPVEYGEFEGVIPKGEYGGGTVLLWDRGTWEPTSPAADGMTKGVLKFRLHGLKLKGAWALVRLKDDPKNWLLIKERDSEARSGSDILADQPLSVSGRTLEQVAADPRAVHSAAAAWASAIAEATRAPLPERREPQLCTLVAEAPAGDGWIHEIKYDGYRLLCRVEAGAVRLITRNGQDWASRFSEVAQAVAALPCRQALIDGEAVVLDANGASDFGALQQALSTGRSQQVVLFAFDLLHLDGYDLSRAGLEDRKAVLAKLLAKAPSHIRYSEHIVGHGPEIGRKACAFALEGIVSKRRDCPSRPGRGGDWLKSKCTARQEFVVVGYTPAGAKGGGFGALMMGYWQDGALRYAGKVGSGYSEHTRGMLLDRLKPLERADPPVADPPAREKATWVEPQLVAEVEFSEWTREGLLRYPVFKGLREDRQPFSVVREATARRTKVPAPDTALRGMRLTHPDKVLWPDNGMTKRALAEHYATVAPLMLPHVAGRPLSLLRCPHGVGAECFFQRHANPGLDPNVKKVVTAGDEPFLRIDDIHGLLALVQMGVLEIHCWGSRADNIMHPDRLCIDLDPDPDLPWQRVDEAAHDIRDRLTALGLQSWVKSTGGKGLHIVIPIEPGPDWTAAKSWCKAFAEQLARDRPDRYVATITKARRTGRILVDYLRNQFSATWVAPYSTRARPGAPVSVPLDWDELDAGLRSDHFTLTTIGRRLAALERDPWAALAACRQTLP